MLSSVTYTVLAKLHFLFKLYKRFNMEGTVSQCFAEKFGKPDGEGE
jgi:hypothetical protein